MGALACAFFLLSGVGLYFLSMQESSNEGSVNDGNSGFPFNFFGDQQQRLQDTTFQLKVPLSIIYKGGGFSW